MSEFKPHDYFEADDQGYISRKVFIEHVRNSYDHMRELSALIKGYDQTIDTYLERWDQNMESLDDDVIGLLHEWIDDSTFATIINEEIFKTKADQVDLEKVTAQLAQTESDLQNELSQKANKSDVRENTNARPINVSEMDTETKQLFTGGSVAVVGKNAVGSENIKAKAVDVYKTDFVEVVSDNLFNKDKVIIGKSINTANGTPVDNVNFSLTGFIPVDPNSTYTSSHQTRYGFYDINFNFINSSLNNGGDPVSTPEQSQFARLAVPTSNLPTFQFNKGGTLPEYDPFKVDIKYLTTHGSSIIDKSIPIEKVDYVESYASSNLFDKKRITPNMSMNPLNGLPIVNSTVSLTDFMPAEEGQKYISNYQGRYGFFKEDKTFISSELVNGNIPITAPSEAALMRVAIPNSRIDEVQINQSDKLLPYEPYAFRLNGAKLYYEDERPKENVFEKEDKFIVVGKTDEVYTAPTITAPPNFQNWTSDQMFALYDDLVDEFPHYVTKTVLGQDGLGDNIYRYDFKFEDVDQPENKVKAPKMILISGIHGTEKAGILALYNSMKQICENWRDHESLETLRWNVHFIIVPIVNLYSFNGNSLRKNENGVDLARNFTPGWQYESDSSSQTYGGEAPLTEQGSILIDQLLKENQDAIYFASFHNFSNHPNQNYFIWNAGATQLQVNLGKQLVKQMTNKWKKEYNWLPQDETTYFGHASGKVPGSEGAQATYYGIHGGTFEISQQFFLEPESTIHSEVVCTLGTETFINWLTLNLKHNTEFYNNQLNQTVR